jgi:hypothetical protein
LKQYQKNWVAAMKFQYIETVGAEYVAWQVGFLAALQKN